MMLTPEPLPPIEWHEPAAKDAREAVTRWQAHLDAGRIGTRQPTPPTITANRAATDALFRAFRSHRAGAGA